MASIIGKRVAIFAGLGLVVDTFVRDGVKLCAVQMSEGDERIVLRRVIVALPAVHPRKDFR